MTMPAYGYEEVIGVGEESTYGTAVASARYFRPVSFGLTQADEPLPLAQVSGMPVAFRRGVAADTAREFKGTPSVTGTIELELDFEDIGIFVKNAILNGDGDTYTNALEGTAQRHTFDRATAVGTSPTPSLTIRRYTGQQTYVFTGCMVNALEIRAEPDSKIRVSIDVLGQKLTRTADSPTTSISNSPIGWFHESNIRWLADSGGAGANLGATLTSTEDITNVHSWTFRLENNLRAIPQTGADPGTRGIRHPIPEDFLRATLTLSTDWESNSYASLWDVIGNTGYGTLEARIISETLIGGSDYWEAVMRFEAARCLSGPTTHGGGMGPIPEEVVFLATGWNDGANDKMYEIQLKNDQVGNY